MRILSKPPKSQQQEEEVEEGANAESLPFPNLFFLRIILSEFNYEEVLDFMDERSDLLPKLRVFEIAAEHVPERYLTEWTEVVKRVAEECSNITTLPLMEDLPTDDIIVELIQQSQDSTCLNKLQELEYIISSYNKDNITTIAQWCKLTQTCLNCRVMRIFSLAVPFLHCLSSLS